MSNREEKNRVKCKPSYYEVQVCLWFYNRPLWQTLRKDDGSSHVYKDKDKALAELDSRREGFTRAAKQLETISLQIKGLRVIAVYE